MTDTFKPADPNAGSLEPAAGKVPAEAGRTLMVGVLGGLLSAAGYLVYQRLPDEQDMGELIIGELLGVIGQRLGLERDRRSARHGPG